jgi:hypothetical protein
VQFLQGFRTVTEQDKLQLQLNVARTDEWLQGDVLHLRWWLMLILFTITAFIWWKALDKSRLPEYLLFSFWVVIFILMLDELGEEMTLWYYTTDLVPWFPPISAINIACLPSAYGLLYRLFRKWKGFLIASAVMSIVFCFALEPLFVWAGIYKVLMWKSWYGLPLYFGIAIASKALVNRTEAPSHRTS